MDNETNNVSDINQITQGDLDHAPGTSGYIQHNDKLVVPSTHEIATAGILLQQAAHAASWNAGWWHDITTGKEVDAQKLVPEKLALVHSEVSEALEGWRKDLQDDKLPHRKMLEVELADAAIRIFDLAGRLGFNLGDAIAEKMEFNANRADHKIENRLAAGGKKI